MNRKAKAMSFGLILSMLCGLMSVAYADTHMQVQISQDETSIGTYQYRENESVNGLILFTTGETDLDAIEISSANYSKVCNSFDNQKGSLPNGTNYTIQTNMDKNGVKTVSWSADRIRDDVAISLTTKKTEYQVIANSGGYGENNNYGTAGSPTCEVSESVQTIAGGEHFSVTFTPLVGNEITYLNLRAHYGNQINLVAVSEKTATVAGKVLSIKKQDSGVVTIECPTAAFDCYITALTSSETEKHLLTVDTDAHITSDISQKTVDNNSTESVTFSPETGYSIGEITITANGKTDVISPEMESVTIDKQIYRVTHSLNGQTILHLPEIRGDVKVSAKSQQGYYYLLINTGKYVDCNYPSSSYVPANKSHYITFTPDGRELDGITFHTGNRTIYANGSDDNVLIDGTRFRISRQNGKITIFIPSLNGNLEITPSIDKNDYTLTVKTDGGVETKHNAHSILREGDEETIIFTPKNGHSITEIRINYDGKIYTADIGDDQDISIKGHRFKIKTTSNGRVSITVRGLSKNMTVRAVSDENEEDEYTIIRQADYYSTILLSKTSPVKKGEDFIITVVPSRDFIIQSVELKTRYDSKIITPQTERFTLGGNTHYTKYLQNGTLEIHISDIDYDITVTSHVEAKNQNTYYPNENLPVNPSTVYHPAYMVGVGNGLFLPESTMTRAEAVTMLVRLYCNVTDSEIAAKPFHTQFTDVSSNNWYSNYISFAENSGFLTPFQHVNQFYPGQAITRGELLSMIFQFAHVDCSGTSTASLYKDMTEYHWAARYVNYATQHGWLSGNPDGTAAPDRSVKRSEVVTLVNRIVGRPAVQCMSAYYGNLFADVHSSYWAYYDIIEACVSHYQ